MLYWEFFPTLRSAMPGEFPPLLVVTVRARRRRCRAPLVVVRLSVASLVLSALCQRCRTGDCWGGEAIRRSAPSRVRSAPICGAAAWATDRPRLVVQPIRCAIPLIRLSLRYSRPIARSPRPSSSAANQ